jgi:threonyl-tRNA synthetase
VVGDRVEEARAAAVRARHGGDRGTQGLDELVAGLRAEVDDG